MPVFRPSRNSIAFGPTTPTRRTSTFGRRFSCSNSRRRGRRRTGATRRKQSNNRTDNLPNRLLLGRGETPTIHGSYRAGVAVRMVGRPSLGGLSAGRRSCGESPESARAETEIFSRNRHSYIKALFYLLSRFPPFPLASPGGVLQTVAYHLPEILDNKIGN